MKNISRLLIILIAFVLVGAGCSFGGQKDTGRDGEVHRGWKNVAISGWFIATPSCIAPLAGIQETCRASRGGTYRAPPRDRAARFRRSLWLRRRSAGDDLYTHATWMCRLDSFFVIHFSVTASM